MTTLICVVGLPAAQGSKRGIPRKNGGVYLQEMAANLGDWRHAVADAAITARHVAGNPPYTGATLLEAVFRFRMPASRPARIRKQGWCWKTSSPDIDKLVRAVCDSLTHSGIISDDKIIQLGPCVKIEIVGGWTGAELRLSPIPAGTERPGAR